MRLRAVRLGLGPRSLFPYDHNLTRGLTPLVNLHDLFVLVCPGLESDIRGDVMTYASIPYRPKRIFSELACPGLSWFVRVGTRDISVMSVIVRQTG